MADSVSLQLMARRAAGSAVSTRSPVDTGEWIRFFELLKRLGRMEGKGWRARGCEAGGTLAAERSVTSFNPLFRKQTLRRAGNNSSTQFIKRGTVGQGSEITTW